MKTKDIYNYILCTTFMIKNKTECTLRLYIHMSDHAGPRRCQYHPGTTFWHPSVEVTQFWHPRSGFGAGFCKAKKDYIDQDAGEKCETKVVGNGSSYCFVSCW